MTVLERAYLAVRASSCSLGCRRAQECVFLRRVLDMDVRWKGDTLMCTAREATHYRPALTDANRHLIGWGDPVPVVSWEERRRRELADEAERDAVEVARRRGDLPVPEAAPPPEVPARAVTAGELEACSPAAKLARRAEKAGWAVAVSFARGPVRTRERIEGTETDAGGMGDAVRSTKGPKTRPAWGVVDSILVQGERGGDRWARAWTRVDGAEAWEPAGHVLAAQGERPVRVSSTEVDRMIAAS